MLGGLTNGHGRLQNAFQDFSPLEDRFLGEVISLKPEDVEDIIEGGGGRLFLESLQKLKAGDSIFIHSNDFTVENG